jgi:ribosomal protein S18 acetylase RimI-like enzyme
MSFYTAQLKTQDYASVKDIFRQTFLKEEIPISTLGFRWRNRSHENSIGAYTSQGDLVGFALVSDGYHQQLQQLKKDKTEKLPECRYLSFLAVHPDYRGANLGSEIISLILKKAINDNKTLCLFPLDNVRLKTWYKGWGFNESPSQYYSFHTHGTRCQNPYLEKIQNPKRFVA